MTDLFERAAEILAGRRRRWATPGELARALDPRTIQTPALELIDAELKHAADTEDSRLIITMPPQEGKSTRVAKDFPTWLLTENPDLRVVTASYGQNLANRNGRAIRNNIAYHPELGISVAADNGSVSEWTLSGYDGGVVSVGIGAGITGRPADLLIIDDPIKDRKEADSPTFRNSVWEWWTDSAATRLAPGAPVVVILTRWHEDDLAGRLLAAEDGDVWRVLNIPAQCDTDDDPLGRSPGEYMQSARRRKQEQWEAIKVRSGSRTWNALYQGRPSPAEGGVFQRDWWQSYSTPLWFVRDDGTHVCSGYDEMMASWDMSFKDTDGTDFVVGQVWLRNGVDAYLLDQVRGRWDFVETVRQFKRLSAKWPQATLKLVEDKANGPAVISALNRAWPGIVPENPDVSKLARASAVAPLVESRNVYLPDPALAPWVGDFVEEHAGFPTAAHDDQVDATSQALKRLVLIPLLAGQIVTVEDIIPEMADHGSYIPRF